MKSIKSYAKYSIRGIPVLPILMMSVITAAAVFLGSGTVNSNVTVAAGGLTLQKTATTCPTFTGLYTSENFTGIIVGSPTLYNQANQVFCLHNTSGGLTYLYSITVSSGALPTGSALWIAGRSGSTWCGNVASGMGGFISVSSSDALAFTGNCGKPAGSPANWGAIASGPIDGIALFLVYPSSASITSGSYTFTTLLQGGTTASG